MKSHFAEYNFIFKKYNPFFPELSLEETYLLFASGKHIPGYDTDPSLRRAIILELELQLFGTVHYFIETPELAEWLIRCGSRLGLEESDRILPNRCCEKGGIMVHTCGTNKTAILVHWTTLLGQHCQASDSRTGFVNAFEGNGLHPDDAGRHPWNLLFGLGAYLDACPEALVEGLPSCAKHPNHFKGEPSNNIVWKGGSHASPCGHLRVSHSRFLRAPCYKFQRRIEVKATWVGPEEETYTVTETAATRS